MRLRQSGKPNPFMPLTGDIKLLVIAGICLVIFLLLFIIVFVILYRQRQDLLVKRNEQIRSEYNQTLLQSQLEIQEQTLKKISEEIHDNIGQVLSLAKLHLNTIDTPLEQEAETKMISAKKLVSKAIQDLRDISHSFNTENIQALGLSRAMEEELEMIRRTGKYTVSMRQEGTLFRLPPQHELILFRVVQECLQNIIKHAEANCIEIMAQYDQAGLSIFVRDDGKGFLVNDQDQLLPTQGLGIRNMNARVSHIGGSVTIESSPGKGTTILIKAPGTTTITG